MHNHCKCAHELKYCECCDEVYCEKCKRAWGTKVSSLQATPRVPYPQDLWGTPSGPEEYRVTCKH